MTAPTPLFGVLVDCDSDTVVDALSDVIATSVCCAAPAEVHGLAVRMSVSGADRVAAPSIDVTTGLTLFARGGRAFGIAELKTLNLDAAPRAFASFAATLKEYAKSRDARPVGLLVCIGVLTECNGRRDDWEIDETVGNCTDNV